MKIWLDDVRKPAPGWSWAKSVPQFEELLDLAGTEVEEIALDHDLGGQLAHYGRGPYDWAAPTGMAAVLLLVKREWLPPKIIIHSTNVQGALNMVLALYDLARRLERDTVIELRPNLGRIMDKTPYYDRAFQPPSKGETNASTG